MVVAQATNALGRYAASRCESRDLVAIPSLRPAVYEAPFPEPGVHLSLCTGLSVDLTVKLVGGCHAGRSAAAGGSERAYTERESLRGFREVH